MSDLLDSAAAALGLPSPLVQRSAAARAAEAGSSVDDILTAWAGGAPAPTAASTPAPQPTAAEPAATAPEPEPTPAPVAVMEVPLAPAEAIEVAEEPEEPLEPVPLQRRLRISARVGAWSGAALGVLGFLVASAFWASTAIVLPDQGPVVQVGSTGLMVGAVLVTVVFGSIVAGLSRSAAASAEPGAQLTSSKSSTVWIGAAMGLVLGVAAGALLSGIGTPIETEEQTLVQLPVLGTMIVMVLGGALIGALMSLIPQIFSTPVALHEADEHEVSQVRRRLGNAVSIPVAGALLLLLLVLPFAYILIESNHLAANGAALVAILVAGGILGFAALAGSRPEMRISFGDVLVAVAGIGTVLVIIVAVLLFNAPEEHGEDGAGEGHAPIVQIL